MGLTDYARQFARKGLPVPLRLIDNIDFELLPQFMQGNTIAENEANLLVKEWAGKNIPARKVQFKNGFIVYTSNSVKVKKEKVSHPPHFRTIEGRRYILIDPNSYKKKAGEANLIISSFRCTGHKAVRVPFEGGFVVYRSIGPKPPVKRKKVPKKVKVKVVKKVEKAKRPPKKERTQAWFDQLTPRMQRRFKLRGYTLKSAHF